ncbi:MAG: pilus assembly FimT family protein [Vicinamibacterales bacterium]
MVGTSAHGVALIDVICSLALVAILTAVAVPMVAGSLERERTLVAAQVLAEYTQRARFEALRRAAVVALKIDLAGGRTSFTLFVDGNGNGVLQRDIDRATDLPITGVQWLDQHARGVSLRINQAVPDISGGPWLNPGDDPLRIGRTSLLSFSPLGSSTGGTLYVAAPQGPQMAIRLYGATGRTRLLSFNPSTQQWQP